MQDKKDKTQKFIMERFAERPRKILFSASLGLVKPRAIIDSSNIEPDKRIEIHANSDMNPVMSLGLDNECFEMIENMQEFGNFCILWKRLGFATRSSSFC